MAEMCAVAVREITRLQDALRECRRDKAVTIAQLRDELDAKQQELDALRFAIREHTCAGMIFD